MKIIRITGSFFIAAFLFQSAVVYDFSVPTHSGEQQPLSAYAGKKVMVITLPVEQSASADSLLYSLDTLAAAHSAALVVVAVPSVEDGYSAQVKDQLQHWYRSKLGAHILLTDGVYTRKTSGSLQHPLFQWLTHQSQNGGFDNDVEGPGSKFITTAQGKLFSVLSPRAKITGRSVQISLQAQ